jgi:hypothetical protein
MYCKWFTCLHVTFAFALLARATATKVSRFDKTRVPGKNSLFGAFAVRVVADLVDKDLDG